MALSSQENPQSAAAALQKLINLPMRGISSLGSHYKAGGEMGGRDGHWFLHGSTGILGEAQIPALQNPLYPFNEHPADPTLPPAAPQSHTGAAESTKTSIAHI